MRLTDEEIRQAKEKRERAKVVGYGILTWLRDHPNENIDLHYDEAEKK